MATRTKIPQDSSATSVEVDVVVVGAGVIGLACAWRCAERGMRVKVIERRRPGAGASGVAAGMLAPVGEATWGEDRLLELALASHRLWPAFAADLARASDADVGYLGLGALHVALDRDEAADLRRRFELMESHGLEARRLAPRECRELEPGLGSAGGGGVHAEHEAAVDPRALIAALTTALERTGATIEIAAASEAVIDGERMRGVRTDDGREHLAQMVLLAAGSWSAAEWLPPEARPQVRPVKGQILTLAGAPGEPVCERIVVTERVYIVPHADGRLIVGATVEEQGFDLRVTAGGVHELLREAYRALPEIAELELVETVAGLRPTTPDNMPLIGPGAIDGLMLATGHFRNGILLAPLTAQRIAASLVADRRVEVAA